MSPPTNRVTRRRLVIVFTEMERHDPILPHRLVVETELDGEIPLRNTVFRGNLDACLQFAKRYVAPGVDMIWDCPSDICDIFKYDLPA